MEGRKGDMEKEGMRGKEGERKAIGEEERKEKRRRKKQERKEERKEQRKETEKGEKKETGNG